MGRVKRRGDTDGGADEGGGREASVFAGSGVQGARCAALGWGITANTRYIIWRYGGL